MARNTGSGSRRGSVSGRTQARNPQTGDFVKRDEGVKSPHKGEFMDVKAGGERFKGVATEPDRRRSAAGGAAKQSQGTNRSARTSAAAKKARPTASKGSLTTGTTPNGSNGTRTGMKRTLAPRRKDAISLLMADHKEARALFREYKRLVKSAASDQKRRELADRVCDALTVHAHQLDYAIGSSRRKAHHRTAED